MPRKRKEQPDNFNKAFPTAMRKLMEKKGTTQNELADYLQKTRQSVSYYCDGSSSPDWETIVKIADFFEVSTDYLLGRTGDPSIKPAATDDLGLSSEAVELMQNFRRYTSCGKDGMDGLNLLIEKGYFLELAMHVKHFCNQVASDIDLSSMYKNDTLTGDDFQIQRINDDLEITSNIEQLIASQHPEYQGRFRIFTGYRYIATLKRELVDDFEKMLRSISGYDNFLTGLPDDGVWL